MRIALLVALTLLTGPAVASDWSRFRGPNGTGVDESTDLPIRFDLEHNLVWSTALAAGYSSPVLTKDRIFLTGETDGALSILAVNDLGDSVYATPAISDGRIYIRAQSGLHCFGKPRS